MTIHRAPADVHLCIERAYGIDGTRHELVRDVPRGP